MKKIVFILILLSFFWTLRTYAAAGNEFLRMDTSVRAAGLGGAFAGGLYGLDGIQYNPSAVNGMRRFGLSFENISMDYGLNFKYFTCGVRLFGLPLAVSAGMLQSDPVSIYDTDESYLGDIRYSDFYGSLTGGFKGAGFFFGVSVRYAQRNIDTYSGSSFLADAGVIREIGIPWPSSFSARKKAGLSLGLAVKNIGSSLCLDRKSESMPMELILGSSFGFLDFPVFHASFLADASYISPDSFYSRLGLSLDYHSRIFLRCGASLQEEKAITAGVGFAASFGSSLKGDFNYALRMDSLGMEHYAGVSLVY